MIWTLTACVGALVTTIALTYEKTPGSAGPVGPRGSLGPQGLVGVSGMRGEAGATGATGPVGPSGSTGPTGAMGDTGITGATGNVGTQLPWTSAVGGTGGLTGPTGAPPDPFDPAGATGPSGPLGATGPAWYAQTITGSLSDPPVLNDNSAPYMIAQGYNSSIVSYDGGANWATGPAISGGTLATVFNGHVWVDVFGPQYSMDGLTWYPSNTSPAIDNHFALRYLFLPDGQLYNNSAGVWLMGTGGAGTNGIYLSTDGINFTRSTDTNVQNAYSIQCFERSGSHLVAGGQTYNQGALEFYGYMVATTDGQTWTVLAGPPILNDLVTSVAYGTPNGVPTWVVACRPAPLSPAWIVYASGATFDDPNNITSGDWITATGATFGKAALQIVWTGAAFVAVGTSPTIVGASENTMVLSSPDGSVWTKPASNPLPNGQGYLTSITWSGTKLCVVGLPYSGSERVRVWTTSDTTGLTGWTAAAGATLPRVPTFGNLAPYSVGIGALQNVPSHVGLADAARKLWAFAQYFEGDALL